MNYNHNRLASIFRMDYLSRLYIKLVGQDYKVFQSRREPDSVWMSSVGKTID